MTNEQIFPKIDHTLLTPTATVQQIRILCLEAIDYKTASVCIPPCYVKQVRKEFPELNICTVVGFPLGYSTKSAKVFEASEAIKNGANEIDMVVNLTWVKEHNFDRVMDEINAVRKVTKGHILKVIAETCYLNQDEKIMLCHSVTTAEADFIKTSTGFGTAGAVREDIKLFSENIGKGVKIKAAGGIKTRKDIEDFLELGCSRIGSSSAVKILTSKKK